MLDMILNDVKALSFTHENHMYMRVKVKVAQSESDSLRLCIAHDIV